MTAVLIPARRASTRLPEKLLLAEHGEPLIATAARRAAEAFGPQSVTVCADDQVLVAAARAAGVDAVMTRTDHQSGTDRIAEVAAALTSPIIVNVQGDEPLIDPASIDAAVEALAADDAVHAATICVPIVNPADIMDPNVVKVVVDFQGDALYFSRAPIPWVRDEKLRVDAQHSKHLGLYVYRRDLLLEFPTLPPGQWEKLEQLEQLRLLENGYKIRVVETQSDAVSVDVPEDVAKVEAILAANG